ncbi:MAG: alcohol dehydrogenase [Thaumarchaeota archaeon]|nr:alcohol dehydrogenase [Nitrososphaerota archaeon]MCY3976271.1 alcohol dehydrogenase [Nitrososphaerota archaeon]
MKAARIISPNKPLEIHDVETHALGEFEVKIKVKSAGICHSDLHLFEGGYDAGDGNFLNVTDRGVKYPITPGHEIAGEIANIGTSVKNFDIGDEVLVYPWIGCGVCYTCRSGDEHLCEYPRSIGVFQDGGYAEFVIVPHYKFLIKASGLNLDEIASLACSGLTSFTSIKKTNILSHQKLAIIGAGGLGLMAIQIAKSITNSTIICIGRNDEKLQAAQKFGADYIINSTKSDVESEIFSINNSGVECVIDFINSQKTASTAIKVLRKCGKLILVGLFGGSLNLSLPTIPLKAITIDGAYTGSYNSLSQLLELAKRGSIKPLISKKYKLNEINNAFSDIQNHKIVGRAIIKP